MNYKAPIFNDDTFNCPFCNTFSHHFWKHYNYLGSAHETHLQEVYFEKSKSSFMDGENRADISISLCVSCKKRTVWIDKRIIYPSSSTAPLPTENMPTEIIKYYCEARDVFRASPRSAAALLRLAIEKLTIILGGQKNKNINDNIAFLVKEGLNQKVQQALDTVRVVGNNAVHPGQIDLDDNPEMALSLFQLLNIIVDRTINEPNEIEKLYESLPKNSRDSIEKRDKNKK